MISSHVTLYILLFTQLHYLTASVSIYFSKIFANKALLLLIELPKGLHVVLHAVTAETSCWLANWQNN